MEYELKYGILSPNDIKDDWYHMEKKRIERPIKPDDSWYWALECKSKFYTKLEDSIKRKGIINPVLIYALTDGNYVGFGCARTWIAKKLNIDVPCVIVDYVNRFTNFEKLNDLKDVLQHYKNVPHVIKYTRETLIMDDMKQIHL